MLSSANPFATLGAALRAMKDTNVNMLIATGGAAEEMIQPDQDEKDDKDALQQAEKSGGRRDTKIEDFAETPTPNSSHTYISIPPLTRDRKHLFRYFIDGSLRTYYLMEAIEGGRAYPIELAQIGAAVMQRDDDGTVHARHIGTPTRRALLLIPKGAVGMSDTAWDALSDACTGATAFDLVNTLESIAGGAPSPERDLRDIAGGKARNRMHNLERDLITATDGERSDDSWLILDGGIQLNEFLDHPYVIGVAKSFSKEIFFPGQTLGRFIDVSTLLMALPPEHRTPAFLLPKGGFKNRIAMWYVRLRDTRALDFPLMGIVKVEMPLLGGQTSVLTEVVDLLSRCLVAERHVTPYGSDARWHCHLYPIFLAEQYIKNGFVTREVVQAAIPWRDIMPARPTR